MERWLVTGGLGFIGSHFIRLVLAERPDVEVVNFDAVTYAANFENLTEVERNPRYRFVRGDIRIQESVYPELRTGVDAVVNFAAETHVDRSILSPRVFLETDVVGVHTLLEAIRLFKIRRFLHVSTDEVYGHVAAGSSRESDPLQPRSPYSASKASSEMLAFSYAETYGTNVVITRGSNTYGPNQYPEKMIPLFTTHLLEDRSVPLYGTGLQIRDWLHVEDHVRGILRVLEAGAPGQAYNLGGGNLRTNVEITQKLLGMCGRAEETHVRHVADRPGHDGRYCVDSSKAHALGWKPEIEFDSGLAETVAWYYNNRPWWQRLNNSEFQRYYDEQYGERGMFAGATR